MPLRRDPIKSISQVRISCSEASPLLWLFALAALMNVRSSFAQTRVQLDPCHAMPKGADGPVKGFLPFDQFNRELRDAITRQDAVALAFLVTFPLRVNDAGGTISLNDAAALMTHFQEVFTPAVRKEILSDDADKGACGAEGIGYGRGVIWVNASERGYSIWSVNRDAAPPYQNMYRNTPKIDYVCQTLSHRIVVDTMVGGGLRYRSWNKPRPTTGTPDLQMSEGKATFEGTNVCAVPIYTFHNSTAIYRVEGGLGCYADSDHVPKDASGRLEVTAAGKTLTEQWCY
jgi:hypothetical protein